MSLTTLKSSKRRALAATAAAAAVVSTGAVMSTAAGIALPGTSGKDVTIGLDNDNADNPFIQPPGVTAKQHMDNTDVLFGRANDDLLIGKLGGDTLLAGTGDDITVGGPEGFQTPNSDVLVGDYGDDVNIWAPGDGSDAFLGDQGKDTMIFAPFVTNDDGSLKLFWKHGRKIVKVDIDEKPNFSCTIVKVPASEKLGFGFLVRFNVNGSPVVTVRQRDVETVYCPSPAEGKAQVARLDVAHPAFRNVWLKNVPGVVGDILAPVG
jgi:hypothetical protein